MERVMFLDRPEVVRRRERLAGFPRRLLSRLAVMDGLLLRPTHTHRRLKRKIRGRSALYLYLFQSADECFPFGLVHQSTLFGSIFGTLSHPPQLFVQLNLFLDLYCSDQSFVSSFCENEWIRGQRNWRNVSIRRGECPLPVRHLVGRIDQARCSLFFLHFSVEAARFAPSNSRVFPLKTPSQLTTITRRLISRHKQSKHMEKSRRVLLAFCCWFGVCLVGYPAGAAADSSTDYIGSDL